MYQIWAYINYTFTNLASSIEKMARKSVDNTIGRRQSHSKSKRNDTFREDVYKFLEIFKEEQFAVLEKLTNEVTELKDHLIETKNEENKKEIKNKNGVTYAELEFLPFEGCKRTKEKIISKEKSIYQIPQQQSDIKPFEIDLLRKVDNLTKENEICNKRIDLLQNQLNLFQQKLQELEMKEDTMKDKDMLVKIISECCHNICYQHNRDISHTIMAFWEGNAQVFFYLFLLFNSTISNSNLSRMLQYSASMKSHLAPFLDIILFDNLGGRTL